MCVIHQIHDFLLVDEDIVYLLNERMIELGEHLVNWRSYTSTTTAVHAYPDFDADQLQRTAAVLANSRTEPTPAPTPIYSFIDNRGLTHTMETEDQHSSDSDDDDDNDDLLSDDDIELGRAADLAQELEEDRLVESFRSGIDLEDGTVY